MIKVKKISKEVEKEFSKPAREDLFKLLWSAYDMGKLNLVIGDVYFSNNLDEEDMDDIKLDEDVDTDPSEDEEKENKNKKKK